MKYAVEMASSVMIPSFIKIGSGIQRFNTSGFTDIQT
jgi:hypothetical protein